MLRYDHFHIFCQLHRQSGIASWNYLLTYLELDSARPQLVNFNFYECLTLPVRGPDSAGGRQGEGGDSQYKHIFKILELFKLMF